MEETQSRQSKIFLRNMFTKLNFRPIFDQYSITGTDNFRYLYGQEISYNNTNKLNIPYKDI